MTKAEKQELIARRAAQELQDGWFVNLGIGLPTLCTKYLPEGVRVTYQSENGIVDTGVVTPETADPRHITDAGGNAAIAAPTGCYIDSVMSFGLIRGGHVNACIIGAFEVDQQGSIASWMVPGKKISGMGGAMDLLAGSRQIIVAMEHTNGGKSKILRRCTLPLTGACCVTKIITELCVLDVTQAGLVMTEINPAYSVEQVLAETEADVTVSDALKPMC